MDWIPSNPEMRLSNVVLKPQKGGLVGERERMKGRKNGVTVDDHKQEEK